MSTKEDKILILILHSRVLIHAWWTEIFWYCEVHNSFLVNVA